ncbi:MAG: hypothetical protein JEY97_04500 [Bacteroidales bacterium]|nr:hypothetical protein [Bacteroidales bacterium]
MKTIEIRKFIILIITIAISASVQAQIIPESKRVNWTNTGYSGEIPNPSLVLNVMDFGALGNGTTNDYQAIIDAINALNGIEGVVFFPQGNYLVQSTLSLPDNVILRGEMPEFTTLSFNLGGVSASCISVSGSVSGDFQPIISNYLKGSNLITITDASVFSIGDFAEIREENGSWDSNPISWGDYSVGQIVKIINISGNEIEIEEALRIDYEAGLNPEIRKINPRSNVGIECLKIVREDNPGEGNGYNIYLGYSNNCWVSGVESDVSAGSHIYITTSMGIEISGCFIHDAFLYDGVGTHGYGVTLNHHCGDCLIENNIFKHLRHAMMVKTGANGNVFSYNYSIEPIRSEPINDFSGDISLHGHYPFSNLFEGNIVQNLIIDHYWGPAGPFNTFFRNRIDWYGIIMTPPEGAPTNDQNFVGNEVTEGGYNFFIELFYGLYYILTGTNHFAHGNNIDGEILPPNTNYLPDTSYYLNATPEFWNVASELPTIGIPNALNSGTIPAKERFLEGNYLVYKQLMANAGENDTISSGDAVSLNSFAYGGAQPYSFQWLPVEGLSNPSIQNPIASPENTTIYTLTVTDSEENTANSLIEIFVNSVTITQTIELANGYQFVSSYLLPENPDMIIVLDEILNDNLDFVRNSDGQMFRKIGPVWVNGIGDWILTEGYLFKMNNLEVLHIEGEIIDPQTPIELNLGYQIISCLLNTPTNALGAFETILNDNLNFIRNSDGLMIVKIGPNWVNGIGNIIPNEGYLINMNNSDVLIYQNIEK